MIRFEWRISIICRHEDFINFYYIRYTIKPENLDLNYFKTRYLLLFLVPALLFSCSGPGKPSRKGYPGSSLKIDLPEIRERRKIIALTDFNATNYFIYRGEPMGYQYDLLQQSLRGLSEHNAFRGQHISQGERSMLEIFQDVSKRLKNEQLFYLLVWMLFR